VILVNLVVQKKKEINRKGHKEHKE